MLNASQLRAARAWLGFSQDELAKISGVAKRTIARIEAETVIAHDRTLRDLKAALEAMGVEFLAENGVGIGIRVSKNID